MNKVKRMLSIGVLLLMFILLAVPVYIDAASTKGNVTYTHGVSTSAKTTYAKISSTKTEDSMKISGLINITYPSSYFTSVTGGTQKYTAQISLITNVNGKKGTSLYYYYVNGTKQHTSTKAWAFDFR